MSASISLEDPTARLTGVMGGTGAAFNCLAVATKGTTHPDVIANLRIQQAWGYAQISWCVA